MIRDSATRAILFALILWPATNALALDFQGFTSVQTSPATRANANFSGFADSDFGGDTFVEATSVSPIFGDIVFEYSSQASASVSGVSAFATSRVINAAFLSAPTEEHPNGIPSGFMFFDGGASAITGSQKFLNGIPLPAFASSRANGQGRVRAAFADSDPSFELTTRIGSYHSLVGGFSGVQTRSWSLFGTFEYITAVDAIMPSPPGGVFVRRSSMALWSIDDHPVIGEPGNPHRALGAGGPPSAAAFATASHVQANTSFLELEYASPIFAGEYGDASLVYFSHPEFRSLDITTDEDHGLTSFMVAAPDGVEAFEYDVEVGGDRLRFITGEVIDFSTDFSVDSVKEFSIYAMPMTYNGAFSFAATFSGEGLARVTATSFNTLEVPEPQAVTIVVFSFAVCGSRRTHGR